MADTVSAPVKAWYESKINWAQAVGVAASVATLFGYVVPQDLIAQTVTGIAAAQGVATWVLRTFFTKSVVASSV